MTEKGPDSNGASLVPKRRIQIDVPEHYKRNVRDNDVWEELEKYIFEGFLTSSATILNRSFVFKTLNHLELRNIGFMKPFKSSPPEAKIAFRSAFIAHSVVMVDGANALFGRPKHIERLVRIIAKIPANLQEKIVENLAAMNVRAASLYPLVEVYVHEPRSRFRWMQLQSIPVHSPMATGMAGTDELGMNHCQSSWTALSRIVDKREEMEKDWSNSKFIGSCFNSKGVRSIDEKDKGRREKDRQELEDLKIKVLHSYLNRTPGGDDAPETTDLPDGRQAVVDSRSRADTVEALAEQLSAALSGEKDHHDLVIEAKIRQIRERSRSHEGHMRQLYTAPPAEVISKHDPSVSGSRILGGKEAANNWVNRMELHRRAQAEKTMSTMTPDLQDSDKGTSEET